MLRIVIFLTLYLSLITAINSQSDRIYTLYVFNKLQYNAAYAGSSEGLNAGVHYRHQWHGVNGAPRTITAFAHLPFAQGRSGVGLSIISDKIGVFNTTKAKVDYAYRVAFKNNKTLSIGLNFQMENTNFDWSKIGLVNTLDTNIPFGTSASNASNFGMGVYYTGSDFYIGAAAPRLTRNAITSKDFQGKSYSDFRPYYLMGGIVFPIKSSLHIRPSILLSYIKNTPIEVDLNLSILFQETFWLGFSYRFMESIDVFVQYPLTPQLKLAVGVDYTLSEINEFTKGSGEIMIEYSFLKKQEAVNNIRFF